MKLSHCARVGGVIVLVYYHFKAPMADSHSSDFLAIQPPAVVDEIARIHGLRVQMNDMARNYEERAVFEEAYHAACQAFETAHPGVPLHEEMNKLDAMAEHAHQAAGAATNAKKIALAQTEFKAAGSALVRAHRQLDDFLLNNPVLQGQIDNIIPASDTPLSRDERVFLSRRLFTDLTRDGAKLSAHDASILKRLSNRFGPDNLHFLQPGQYAEASQAPIIENLQVEVNNLTQAIRRFKTAKLNLQFADGTMARLEQEAFGKKIPTLHDTVPAEELARLAESPTTRPSISSAPHSAPHPAPEPAASLRQRAGTWWDKRVAQPLGEWQTEMRARLPEINLREKASGARMQAKQWLGEHITAPATRAVERIAQPFRQWRANRAAPAVESASHSVSAEVSETISHSAGKTALGLGVAAFGGWAAYELMRKDQPPTQQR